MGEKFENEYGGQGPLLSNTCHGYSIWGHFHRSPPKQSCEPLGSLPEIVQVSLEMPVFLTRRPYIAEKIVRCFSAVVRALGGTTMAGIKSILKIILHRKN